MGGGFICVVTVDLHLPTATSLKDKRKPLAGLKAAVIRATGCSVSEVDHHDRIRRARISLAALGAGAAEARRLGEVAERVIAAGPFEILSIDRHIVGVDEIFDTIQGGS